MLSFEKGYFEETIISNYTVNSIAKRHWAALLEVLSEIDIICRKYDIQYYVYWGTLLGAIRHEGFIPWDDDMDLAMKREDYEKFQKILPIEFQDFEKEEENRDNDILFFYSPTKGEKNVSIETIISNGKSINFEEAFLRRYHGYPFVASIDIFPLDYFPEDNSETELIYNVIKILEDIIFIDENWGPKQKPANEGVIVGLNRIEQLVGYKFDYSSKLRKQALILMDALSKMYSREESKYLFSVSEYSYNREENKRCEKEWFDEVIFVPFENIKVPVPKEYDKILTAMYGDYMTPVIFEGHGFNQKKILEEVFDFNGKDPITTIMDTIGKYE